MTVVIDGTAGIDTGTGSLVSASSTTPTYLDLFEDTDNGSNYVRLIAPTSVASNRTITLPDGTGTVAVNGVSGVLVSGSAITLTNQTAPEFTSVPSWAKRIIVMFSSISTNGTGIAQVQVGSGSFTTSGYASTVIGGANANAITATANTSGFVVLGQAFSAASSYNGVVQLLNINGNTWVAFGGASISGANSGYTLTGSIALSGVLDRVRLFIDGTQQFDAGTFNIMWE